jgi:hypothetical protein
VYDPPCPFDDFSVDAAQDTSGVAHGFAQLWCEDDLTIHYFEGSGGTWTQEATPYQGFVMGVAWDTTGTYLLYLDVRQGQGVRITKRLTDGTYTPGRLLSRNWASSSDTRATWWRPAAGGGRSGTSMSAPSSSCSRPTQSAAPAMVASASPPTRSGTGDPRWP